MPSAEVQIEPAGKILVRSFAVTSTPQQIVLSPSVRTRSVLFTPDPDSNFVMNIGTATNQAPIYGPTAFDVNLALGNIYAAASASTITLYIHCLVDEEGQ